MAIVGHLAFVPYNRLSCAPVRCANTMPDLLIFFKAVFNLIGLFKHFTGYALAMAEASLLVKKLGVKTRF